MMMPAGLRKFTFAAHITSSVGWVGAVIVFLALAVVALTSQSEMTVRGAYLVMAPAAWFVLVPLAHASLISGVALSLGTTWGFVRHLLGRLKARDYGFLHRHPADLHGHVQADGGYRGRSDDGSRACPKRIATVARRARPGAVAGRDMAGCLQAVWRDSLR